MVKYSFQRELRLVSPDQFDYVFKDPIKASSPNLTILARANSIDHARIGIIVSKKTMKLAVDRNRFKRLTRNHFRLNNSIFPNIDMIVLAKGKIGEFKNEEVIHLLDKLCKTIYRRFKK